MKRNQLVVLVLGIAPSTKGVILYTCTDVYVIYMPGGEKVLNVLTCFNVLFSDCLVDGNPGDGTARGTCPEFHLCQANGRCRAPPGTL